MVKFSETISQTYIKSYEQLITQNFFPNKLQTEPMVQRTTKILDLRQRIVFRIERRVIRSTIIKIIIQKTMNCRQKNINCSKSLTCKLLKGFTHRHGVKRFIKFSKENRKFYKEPFWHDIFVTDKCLFWYLQVFPPSYLFFHVSMSEKI